MILVTPLPPTPLQVVVGVGTVVIGSLIATCSGYAAWHARNWLYHLGTLGGLLIVAGVVGQRTAVDGAALGPWDAGINVPLLGVRMNPVTAAGIIVCLLGLVVGLLVERVADPAAARATIPRRRFEDEDTV